MAEAEASGSEAGSGAPDPDPGGLKSLATSTEQAQGSARWLIGALAGIGTLLVPALGLTKLGALEGTRLAVAIAALAVALLAVLLTIYALMRFVRSGHVSMADLAERERKSPDDPLVEYLKSNDKIFREQAKSPEGVQKLYIEAHENLAEAQRRAAMADPPKHELEAQEAAAALERLKSVEAAVMDAARLAGHPELTLADLANAQRARMRAGAPDPPAKPGVAEALDYLAKHPYVLGGVADTFDELRSKLLDAHTRVLELGAETDDADEVAPETVDQAEARLLELDRIIGQVEAVAGLEDLRQTFKRRRWQVAVLPLVIVTALAAFVWASNEPPVDRNDLSGQTIRNADLSGTKLEHADLSDTTFVDSDLTGADLDHTRREGTRFVRSRCPDGHLTASRGPGASCAGHLKVVAPPDIRPTSGRGGDDGRG
jgi:hypothetical protein